MTTAGRREPSGPWPGPIPYDEEHRRFFHGRERELGEVLSRLSAENLVLLTGMSGVGKTSFLRAGLVPALRDRRATALQHKEPTIQPAVLVVRDWLQTHSGDPNAFFNLAIRESVDDMRQIAPLYAGEPEICAGLEHDYEKLLRVKSRENAYHYVIDLARAAGSLVLVLDQFEEAVRGSISQAANLWKIVADLYKNQHEVRLLISFRREFLARIRSLETRTGLQLRDQTYDLPPMQVETVRLAIQRSAAEAGMVVETEPLQRLMDWMKQAELQTSVSRLAPGRAGLHRPEGDLEFSADLLKLQALLVEVHEIALGEIASGSEVRITSGTLDRLIDLEEMADSSSSGARLVGVALERFIDRRVLPIPQSLGLHSGLTVDLARREFRMLQHRRAAARMAEFFSAGPIKVQQPRGPLVARTWRDEWQVLDTDAESVERTISNAEDDGPDVRGMELGRLLGLGDEPISRSAGVLSGFARAEKWTARRVADELLGTSLEALDKLADGNVVRPRPGVQGQTYELVHDGFGRAFVAWAEDHLKAPLDVLAATTAQRGVFDWRDLTGIVRDVCWRSCTIGPATGLRELILDNVAFVDCDLTGTVFERCTFRGGKFENCVLDFVIFRECKFEAGVGGTFVFDGVRASGLTFHGGSANEVVFQRSSLWRMYWTPLPWVGGEPDRFDLSEVVLEDCYIRQWTVDNVRVVGPLSVRRCNLGLCDLDGLSPDIVHVSFNDCTFVYCPVNDALFAAIQRAGARNSLEPGDTAPIAWQDFDMKAEGVAHVE